MYFSIFAFHSKQFKVMVKHLYILTVGHQIFHVYKDIIPTIDLIIATICISFQRGLMGFVVL